MAMTRLAARVLTGTTLAVGAALLLWLETRFPPGFLALGVVTALALIAVWELQGMGTLRDARLGTALLVATAALAVRTFLVLRADAPLHAPRELGWLYLLALGGAVLGHLIGRVSGRAPRGELLAVGLALWLLPALFALVLIDLAFGVKGLALLVILAKVGDNAGFFVGRAIGKRHPFPNVSPGKTVAGCVASLLAGLVAGALVLSRWLGEGGGGGMLVGALVGTAINVAAQASDLSESWVKRRAGVKDSSRLVGPSGGVLDVIDSLFFAAPTGLLLWAWVY